MPKVPILILLASSPAPPDAAGVARAADGEPMILGLSLTRRAVLAARRAGYGQVFLLAGNASAARGVAAFPNWSCLAAIFSSSHQAPLFIAPTAILAETDWLERLAETPIEPAAWAAIPNRIIMIAAASVAEALATLDEEGGARDLTSVESRLARLLGPPAPIPARIDPMVIETSTDVRVAERRLMRTLVKDTDGYMARH
jgi:hypothetical protein